MAITPIKNPKNIEPVSPRKTLPRRLKTRNPSVTPAPTTAKVAFAGWLTALLIDKQNRIIRVIVLTPPATPSILSSQLMTLLITTSHRTTKIQVNWPSSIIPPKGLETVGIKMPKEVMVTAAITWMVNLVCHVKPRKSSAILTTLMMINATRRPTRFRSSPKKDWPVKLSEPGLKIWINNTVNKKASTTAKPPIRGVGCWCSSRGRIAGRNHFLWLAKLISQSFKAIEKIKAVPTKSQ